MKTPQKFEKDLETLKKTVKEFCVAYIGIEDAITVHTYGTSKVTISFGACTNIDHETAGCIAEALRSVSMSVKNFNRKYNK